jgi:hypothetical protein
MRHAMRHQDPIDQAAGLRRLFGERALRVVPLVSNPFVAYGGVVIERMCTAFGQLGLHTLVVDASERARAPAELAGFDLAEGVQTLSATVSYMAARGLPVRYVDATGSTARFADALADAVPQARVAVVHASAADLARMLGRGAATHRPVLLCDASADAMKHAYASLKLLCARAHWHAHDLVLCAEPGSVMAERVAQRLAECADRFIGAVQRGWAAIDPSQSAVAQPPAAFARLLAELYADTPPHNAHHNAPYNTHHCAPRAEAGAFHALPSRASHFNG